jgi:hypothetical protein
MAMPYQSHTASQPKEGSPGLLMILGAYGSSRLPYRLGEALRTICCAYFGYCFFIAGSVG